MTEGTGASNEENVGTATTGAVVAADDELLSIHKLSDLSRLLIGKKVKLHGWVYSTRSQGAGSLVFVDLCDGTTVTPCRCIAEKKEAPEEDGEKKSDSDHYYGSLKEDDLLTKNKSNDEAFYQVLTFEELGQSSFLSMGCSIQMIGSVVDPPPGTTQSFEIKILLIRVIGKVPDPSQYPIQKSNLKKPALLRGLSHARFRAPLIQQFMIIRSQALFAVHEFFHQEGVPILDPNILTSSDCEGAGEVFKISPQMFHNIEPLQSQPQQPDQETPASSDPTTTTTTTSTTEGDPTTTTTTTTGGDLDTNKIKALPEVGLTVSSQLPLEAIAMGTRAVYTCQKSFRAEKSDTNKHLAEFLHIEYEEYFNTLDTLMDQAERFVKHVIQTVLQRCPEQYTFLNTPNLAPPEFQGHGQYLASLMEKPFVRIRHADAIDLMLKDLRDKAKTINEQGKEVKLKFKVKPEQGQDLGSEHEKYLVQKFGTFVFVTHWPAAIKSFYMKQLDGSPYCESFDLLAPRVGELFGGSMREWRYPVILKILQDRQMDATPLQWYMDLRKDGGTAPHGGWGMGFDRLCMLLTNVMSVRDVVPYPVYYGHCPY